MEYIASIPSNINSNETIVLPISMSQPLERGKKLESILTALKENGYQKQTTILVCDYLNRHNCKEDSESLRQGKEFIEDHVDILEGFNVIHWADFIQNCGDDFIRKLNDICEKSPEQSRFYNKMKKTWEKCLSATQSLESSILYQREEYAAVLCMSQFDYLLYPKRITNGLAYLYNHFSEKKPQYHHVKISEKNKVNKIDCHKSIKESSERRHLHVAFRAIIDHVDYLLKSNEMSEKAKKLFAEEMENVLMSHGLGSSENDILSIHPQKPQTEGYDSFN